MQVFKGYAGFKAAIFWIKTYKLHILRTAGIFGLAAGIIAGCNYHVELNMNQVFHVYVDDKEAGTVSDPAVVRQFISAKQKKLLEDEAVHWVMNSEAVTLKAETAFKAESDDEQTIDRVEHLLKVTATGVKLKVDGKVIAVVKDRETANAILLKIKNQYIPDKISSGKVSILSAEGIPALPESPESVFVSADIMENIEMEVEPVNPKDIADPEEVVSKLNTGEVKPLKYIVKEGDCISCIAQKFNISAEQIYEMNPWIKDDLIGPGDELELTKLQPLLSVQTVEKIWETEEMLFDTVYQLDENMLAGQTKILKPGENGVKKMAFQLTKVNGELVDEQFLEEIVIEEPIPAMAVKGTKVILGVGTGKISWPVLGAKISSTFGKRWGQMHAGIDLTSSNKNILAADDGEVIFAGKKNGYGNVIIIDHNNGYRTLYGHLSKILIEEGSFLEKGQKIGIMGSTGRSTGVHLHFEIQKNGNAQNPLKYLNK